ncbi:MAG: autotransporter domain-containing protein [Achromobacter sp.]
MTDADGAGISQRCTPAFIPRALAAATLFAACGMSPAATAQTIVGSGDILPGHPADWAFEDTFIVGDTASGTLRISDGPSLNNNNGVVGKEASATGTFYVSGPGSRWILGQTLSIGYGGTGTLNLWNAGRVQVLGSETVSLAKAATATGTINIGAIPGAAPAAPGQLQAKEVFFGAGTAKLNFNTDSVVDFAARLRSDGSGIHELNQYNGTTRLLADSNGFLGKINVTGGELKILDRLGSDESTIDSASGAAIPAIVTVDGPNAVWANSGNLFVGKTSTGALAVTNGAQVNNLFGTVEAQQNGFAQVTVSGGGSVWRNSHALSVGTQGGQGKVSVEAGGSLFSADGYLGGTASGVGTVTVAGTGSSWHNDGNLRVGDISGQGSLSVLAGGVVSNRIALIGSAGGTGKVTVSGTGSEWSSTGALYIGYGIGSANGTLTINDGGTVTTGVAGALAVELVSNAFPFLPSTATLNIGGEAGQAAVRAGTLNAAEIAFGAGIASLNFNHTDAELRFAPGLRSVGAGLHRLNQVAGTTVLMGNSAGFTGKTTVSGGKLVVLDKLGGSADVSGGTLQYGNGTTGSANLLSGNLSVAGNRGTLSIQGPATLQVTGDLVLANNSILEIGAASGGAALRAAAVSLGTGTVFNLIGIADNSQLETVLIDTQNGIQGNFSAVNVGGGTGQVDYLTAHTSKSADNLQYRARYDLSWTANTNLRNGTFTLPQSTDRFNLGVALEDQMANAATGWNGTTLTKAGAGTLVLAGENTYTGGTEVRRGTLSVSKDANLGAASGGLMLSGGVLATTASFDTNRVVTLSQSSGIDVAQDTSFGLTGAMTGNGNLTKSGMGTLTVSGDSSTYTGNTLVQSGVLNLAPTGKLGGTLTLASGALLQGTGQVGSTTLQSGATLSPGPFNSTLHVAGDLTFMPGSIYQVTADPASSDSARVAVSGTANLAGSVVHVGPESDFNSTRQYTILTAGTVVGQFNTVSSHYAYLNPALRYGAQDVTLQLERKQVPVDPVKPVAPSRPVTFADLAQSANQRAVANALESLPTGNALHEYILTLPNGAPPAVFNSLSGEAHASVASSLMGASTTTRTLPLSHLRANLNAGMRPGAPTAQAGGTLAASALPSSNAQPAWAELVGSWQTQKATDNTAQVRQHVGGVFAGADHAMGDGWRVGGAVGYTDSKIHVDDRASQADVSGYSAAIYGGKAFEAGVGKLNLLVGTSYTWHDVSTRRYATVAGASQKLTADYGASTTQLFTELGYALPLSDQATIEPFAGLAWSDLRTRGFSESGGSAALRGQSSNNPQTTSTLGARAQTDFTLAGAEGRLQATLGWRHAFGDVLPQTRMAFDGGQAFTVSGSPIARNAALAELGAEVAVSRNASVGLNYSGQYGGGNREHAGALNVRWRY